MKRPRTKTDVQKKEKEELFIFLLPCALLLESISSAPLSYLKLFKPNAISQMYLGMKFFLLIESPIIIPYHVLFLFSFVVPLCSLFKTFQIRKEGGPKAEPRSSREI